MADLTATDWTITATGTVIHSKERTTRIVCTIASGNAGVYPLSGSVGIPLPTTPGSYGMVRNLDYIIFDDFNAGIDVFGYKFVSTGPGVKMYGNSATAAGAAAVFTELASGTAPANTAAIILRGTAHGW